MTVYAVVGVGVDVRVDTATHTTTTLVNVAHREQPTIYTPIYGITENNDNDNVGWQNTDSYTNITCDTIMRTTIMKQNATQYHQQ